MAIGPQNLDKLYQMKLDSFESEIDQMLMHHSGTSPKNVTLTPPRGMNSSDFYLIRDRYIQAGWNDVSYHDDQRDGSYITFKA